MNTDISDNPSVQHTDAVCQEKHFKEWATDSGVDPELVKQNVVSLTVEQARKETKYKTLETGGWIVRSKHDPSFWQFKPDHPHTTQSGEPAKYLTPFGSGKKVITLESPYASSYEDVDTPIVITEGAKKCGAVLSCGFPCVALTGVTMGTSREGKIEQSLSRFALPGRVVILAFDGDWRVNIQVLRQLEKLIQGLTAHGCIPKVAVWNQEDGKGFDDMLVAKGVSYAFSALEKAIEATVWSNLVYETLITSSAKKKRTLPPSSKVAEEIASLYNNELTYDSESGVWWKYNLEDEGIWGFFDQSLIQGRCELNIRKLVASYLDLSHETRHAYNENYVKSIVDSLSRILSGNGRMDENTSKTAFRNGVLDTTTSEFYPHSPTHRMTWVIPFDYVDSSDCPGFEAALRTWFPGDESIQKLVWALLACLLRRYAVKMKIFVLFYGVSNSAKSTLSKVFEEIVGKDNFTSCSIHRLNALTSESQYEALKLQNKALVVFPDQPAYTGDAPILKQMTGDDYITARRPYGAAAQIKVSALPIWVTNSMPRFTGENSSALFDRMVPIHFSKSFSRAERNSSFFENVIRPELPNIICKALSMPIAEIEATISESKLNDGVLETEYEIQLNDPVFSFLDSQMAVNSVESGQSAFVSLDALYTKYTETSDSSRNSSMSKAKFRTQLESLLEEMSHKYPNRACFSNVKFVRHRNGMNLKGWRLRREGEGIPYNCKPSCIPIDELEKFYNAATGAIEDGTMEDAIKTRQESLEIHTSGQDSAHYPGNGQTVETYKKKAPFGTDEILY